MSASLTPTPEAHDTAQAYFRSLLDPQNTPEEGDTEEMTVAEGGRTAVKQLFRRGFPHLIQRPAADERAMQNWRRSPLIPNAPSAEQ